MCACSIRHFGRRDLNEEPRVLPPLQDTENGLFHQGRTSTGIVMNMQRNMHLLVGLFLACAPASALLAGGVSPQHTAADADSDGVADSEDPCSLTPRGAS